MYRKDRVKGGGGLFVYFSAIIPAIKGIDTTESI